jgi:DNA-binding NarL/FixJ family response regulator
VIRLVIVDDNSMVLDGLRALFETVADFSVVGEGTNGLEGIVAARDAAADVVLMDVSMPTMDGIEACRRLSVECPSVKVVMYSALGGEGRAAAAKAAGAVDYLGKDLEPEELVSRVRSLAQGEGAASAIAPAERIAHAEARPRQAAAPSMPWRAQPEEAAIAATPQEKGGPAPAGPGDGGATIAVLTPLLAGTYVTELMSGISAAADAAGVRLIAIQTLDPGVPWSAEHPFPRLQPGWRATASASAGTGWTASSSS